MTRPATQRYPGPTPPIAAGRQSERRKRGGAIHEKAILLGISARNAFRRALETRSIVQAEHAMREMRRVPLLDALDYVALLAVERSERLSRPRSGGWPFCYRSAAGYPWTTFNCPPRV
jgi:hypothetical protein